MRDDALVQNRGQGSGSKLTGNNRLLFIFVSDEGATPWTPELRQTTEVQIGSALHWLEKEARRHGSRVSWKHLSLPSDRASIAVPVKIDPNDAIADPLHAGWQNIAASLLVGTPGTVASLWGKLFRPLGACGDDSGCVILFCVRRYAASISFPYSVGLDTEFEKERGIIYDLGGELQGQRYLDSLIAHELLHLYGAIDLAPGKVEKVGKSVADVILARTTQKDIMLHPTQRMIESYEVGDLTAWLVGWSHRSPLH